MAFTNLPIINSFNLIGDPWMTYTENVYVKRTFKKPRKGKNKDKHKWYLVKSVTRPRNEYILIRATNTIVAHPVILNELRNQIEGI